ncbi:MAG: alpha/beta fold hydrolase [Caldilineaceae bacterium]|nr:alpha/beta fold hydrolase [Caldilineaceae bacterium]MCB9139792.1 alpha/beta fold hydrolase [Caldilineaceae bacterium]
MHSAVHFQLQNETSGANRVSSMFTPHPLVRSATVQTVLSSVKSTGEIGRVMEHEQPFLIDAGVDETGYDPAGRVRLLAYFNAVASEKCKGLVLMLHGWEGCSHSNYSLMTTNALLSAGYDVVRINLRDHGPGIHADPHALNKGYFLGTLLNETITAVEQIARLAGDKPFFIVGASMGGNFALRLARAHTERPFHNLHGVIAFSPAINPAAAIRAMDAKPAYRRYFRRRWSASLARKQALFPDDFHFDDVLAIPGIYAMTDVLARKDGLFASAADYLDRYRVHPTDLQELTAPVTIITALDDPVIPIADFYALAPHPLLDVHIERFGGHVGWVDILPLHHDLPDMVLTILARYQTETV